MRAKVESFLKNTALAVLPHALVYRLWHLRRRSSPRSRDSTSSDHRVVNIQDGAKLEVYWSRVKLGSGPCASLYVLEEEILRLDCFDGDRAHMHLNPIQANLPLPWSVTPRCWFPPGSAEEQIDRAAFELRKNTAAVLLMNQLASVRAYRFERDRLKEAAAEMKTEMLELLKTHEDERPSQDQGRAS